MNYSDKTVSKWERGDSVPDLKTICQMAELFGVTVDYFVTENAARTREKYSAPREEKGYHIGISLLFVVCVWIAITMCYVYLQTYMKVNYWILFVWGVPISLSLLMVLNRKWGKGKNRVVEFVLTSLLSWTFLVSVYLQLLKYNIWTIFFVGIPVQAALALWTYVRIKYRN